MWLSSSPPGNSHTFTQLFHGSLPASSQDNFFLPSYQLKRFSQEEEEREKLSGHPKHYHIQNGNAQAQICVQRALCQMLPNWNNKFYRGTAYTATRHSVVTFTLSESLRLMLRARCFRLITYSIRVYYNQIKEIALALIT